MGPSEYPLPTLAITQSLPVRRSLPSRNGQRAARLGATAGAAESLLGAAARPAPMTAPRHLDESALGDHIDRLYRAAWAMCGSPGEAEDLVQETFARVLSRPRLLRSRSNDLAYLLKALRNTFLDTRRAASRRPQTTPIAELPDMIDRRDSQRIEDFGLRTQLLAAILTLSDELRDALIAVDLVGLSYREASQQLGAPEATIATRLFRARQKVAGALTEPESSRAAQ